MFDAVSTTLAESVADEDTTEVLEPTAVVDVSTALPTFAVDAYV